MGTRHPGVDAYIERAAPFAQPVLRHLRTLVHRACPKATETLKWGMPHFEHHGVLCSMAAFRQHCTFGFWKYKLLARELAQTQRSPREQRTGMGQFGRIASLDDLPSTAALTRLVKRAAALNEQGAKIERPPPRKPPRTPPDLATALRKDAAARQNFEAFTPSARRDYIEWILEAKRKDTRAKRLATTLELSREGKTRNWKYVR